MEENTRLTLREWDQLVGRHLSLIEAGAEICERHVKLLKGLPEWETRAAQDIEVAERSLREAYLTIVRVRKAMEDKPRVD